MDVRDPEQNSSLYAPAQLSPDLVEKIRDLEDELRAATSENIVLVAYDSKAHSSY